MTTQAYVETLKKRIATLEDVLLKIQTHQGLDRNNCAMKPYEILCECQEWAEAVLAGHEWCPGCGNEIDPEVCHCGEPIKGHTQEHGAVPMGCDCGRVKSVNLESLL